jgi:beta-lactamase regulating signal transducer with metallopeptidase domain
MHTTVPAIILDTLLKATLLLGLAWGATLMLKRRSASMRHMVRFFALAALLLLPLSVLLLPAWHVKGIPDFAQRTAASVQPASTNAAATYAVAATAPESSPGPAKAWRRVQSGAKVGPAASLPVTSAQQSVAAAPLETTPEHVTPDSSAPQAAQIQPVSTPAPRSMQRSSIFKLVLLLWMSGSFLFLLRWRLNSLRLAALLRRATVVTDSGWNEQVRALARETGIARHVALLASHEIEVPITSGTLFPQIVLSPDYAEWSALRRTAILKHELAHIKRLDAFTQALAHLATSLYWFHPLVWLMARAMRSERERACDDQVLASGTKASDYAHELLEIVSGLREPELAAALAMARRSQLEGRVLAVLNPALPRGTVSVKTALALAILTLGLVLPLAALRPAAQQAGTPEARPRTASQQKPSPASTPAIAAQPDSSSAPAAYAPSTPSAAPAPQAATPEPDDQEAAEAPEPPETPAASEPAEAPPALIQSGTSRPGSPATPAAPAAPGAPGAPAAPAAPAAPPSPGGELSVCGTRIKLHNMSIESHDGNDRHWTANWSGDDCSVDLRAQGEIKFNAEATDIQSISSGGFFEVNVRQGDTLKQVKVTPSASGLQYVYKINGQQQPLTGDAKAWFSQFLLSLERSTGFAADARVPALLAKGGPNAVLDEINNLLSDYVRGLYFRKLLEQPNLPAPVVQRVMRQAGEQMHSDYELARVLMTVSKQYDLPDEASRAAFLTAAGKLTSDYEHSRVLIELLRRPNISKENVGMALNSAGGIKSDYEKSRILLSLMEQKSFEQSQLDFYLRLVASIHSDYEKSRDLLAPMQKYKLAPEQVNRIMDATASMNSDYEKSRLLLGLARQGKFDETQMANYLKVVDSMKSDYERSRSLLELMQNNTLTGPSVSKAMEDISRATSDYEKSRVLTTLVQANKFDESQMSSYLNVMSSMKSDYERSRCLLALMDHNKLSNASVAKVLEAAGHVQSDYEKARVLQAVAHAYPLEGALRESYIKAADSIGNEYERNRALAAVVKRATL